MALDLGPSIRALYEEVNSRVSSLTFSFSARFCAFPPFPPAPLRHLPLLASPTLPLLLVSSYVLISAGASSLIHALRLKPREKEPRVLLAYVAAHNLLLFGLSAFLAVSVPLEAFRLGCVRPPPFSLCRTPSSCQVMQMQLKKEDYPAGTSLTH